MSTFSPLPVGADCQSQLNTTIENLAPNIFKQAKLGLYGYRVCCDELQQNIKASLISNIISLYNVPNNTSNVEQITYKQGNCICTWVSRALSESSSGGGGGDNTPWSVTYNMPTPDAIFINTPGIFAAITGDIDIQSSVGTWTDVGFGANAIGYGGNTTRNFDINVSVAVSSATPVSVDYSWQKSVGGVMIYENTPQGSATTPGGNVPHATVNFTATWSPTQSGDLFAVQIRQNDNFGESLTLTTFNVTIIEQ